MKFEDGQFFSYGGVDYRVRKGKNGSGDLVIEFTVNGWHRPHIAHTLILASFKAQVENNNYGKNGSVQVARGSAYLMDVIHRAIKHGWKAEAERIALEREKKNKERLLAQAQLGLPI